MKKKLKKTRIKITLDKSNNQQDKQIDPIQRRSNQIGRIMLRTKKVYL